MVSISQNSHGINGIKFLPPLTIDSLPEECLKSIFSYLLYKDQALMVHVSHKWDRIILDNAKEGALQEKLLIDKLLKKVNPLAPAPVLSDLYSFSKLKAIENFLRHVRAEAVPRVENLKEKNVTLWQEIKRKSPDFFQLASIYRKVKKIGQTVEVKEDRIDRFEIIFKKLVKKEDFHAAVKIIRTTPISNREQRITRTRCIWAIRDAYVDEKNWYDAVDNFLKEPTFAKSKEKFKKEQKFIVESLVYAFLSPSSSPKQWNKAIEWTSRQAAYWHFPPPFEAIIIPLIQEENGDEILKVILGIQDMGTRKAFLKHMAYVLIETKKIEDALKWPNNLADTSIRNQLMHYLLRLKKEKYSSISERTFDYILNSLSFILKKVLHLLKQILRKCRRILGVIME